MTTAPNQRPVGQLATNRGLLKYILLSMVTFGIYALIVFYTLTEDVNIIASRYDGKRTMNYALLVFLIAPLTLGIGLIVWMHRLYNRVGAECQRRGTGYNISALTFWGWGVLGAFIIVGPFISLYKLFKATNLIAADYNQVG